MANVYIPPENSKATEDWQQVLNGHQGTGRLIMAGDMNAHEHWDNFLDEDKRGTEFAEWMQSNALEAANDPNVHTRTSPSSGGRSSPDLTLASNQLIDNVRESWETGEDVGSDHLPIFFRLGTKLSPPRRRKARFVFKKARWEGFRESLSAKSERGNSVNEYYKHLVEDILKAAKENIPMGARLGRMKPFWSSKCQELVTARNEARKVAEQTGTEADVKAFKVARNLAAKGIKREKKAFWDERCQKMSIETDLFRTLKTFRGDHRAEKGAEVIRRTNRTSGEAARPAVTNQQKADLFCQLYAEVSSVERRKEDKKVNREATRILRRPRASTQEDRTKEFMMEELELALSVLKTGKAPGPEEITNEMLNNLDKATKSRLLKLFNWALREGVSPAGWRRSTIIPVHKKGKPREDPSSYRPVALTSCMAKLMERMVATRLIYHLESQKI